MTSRYCFLHHQLVEMEKAALPVQDRGFRFGDGVFETIRVHQGVPLFWQLHMARLQEGLRALNIPSPAHDLAEASKALLRANEVSEGILRIAISRGVGSRGYLPHETGAPTLLIEAMSAPTAPPHALHLWLSRYEKISPRALPVQLKLAQGLNSTLARMEAESQGCDEAILLNAQGELAEASSGNLFWWKDGTLYTPALECGPLAGVTRAVLLNLTEAQEVRAPLDALKQADGVFVCNASMGLRPCDNLQPNSWEWPVPTAFEALKATYQQAILRNLEGQAGLW